jgi:hypothetical protein
MANSARSQVVMMLPPRTVAGAGVTVLCGSTWTVRGYLTSDASGRMVDFELESA